MSYLNDMNKTHIFYLVDGAVSMDKKANTDANLIYKWIGLFEEAIETVKMWNARSKTRNQLLNLNDRTLQDIGLTRSEAQFEANKFFWQA